MKTKLHDEPKFAPVTISITFETQKELDDFGTLCNHIAFADTISLPDLSFMEDAGAKIGDALVLEGRIMSHPCMMGRWIKSK